MGLLDMTITNQIEKLLTPEQTAEILGISSETLNVWRCTKRYPLPYVKVGRLVRYRMSDLNQFIESQLEISFASNGLTAR
jgi:excisionase family DNA binding protein